MNLSGNTVLITGGTRGIGFSMAEELLQRGNTVIITGSKQESVDTALQKNSSLIGLVADMRDPKQIKDLSAKVIRNYPQVNTLINNAGTMLMYNSKSHQADLSLEIDVNFRGPVQLTDLMIPHFLKKQEASITYVTSGLAFVPLAPAPIYCATKAALHSYAQSMRLQLEGSPIKVFELAPPLIDTELTTAFNDKMFKKMSTADLVKEFLASFENDRYEIAPGFASILRTASKIAPKAAAGMLATRSMKYIQE